jgi:hypothetical protein
MPAAVVQASIAALTHAGVALHLKPGFALYIYQWFSGI